MNQKILIPNDKNIFDINNITFQKYLKNKYNKGRVNIFEILKKNFTIIDCRQSDLRLYENFCPTLRTGRHGLFYTNNNNIYKLSAKEAFLMQGYSLKETEVLNDSLISETRLLSQIGNAMTVSVIKEASKSMLEQFNKNNNSKLIHLGSQTAKNGFKNEKDIEFKFNNWKDDSDAQLWLSIMQYSLHEIEYVKANIIHGFKADISVHIQLKESIDVENIQVKLVSSKKGFNQVDKRRLERYKLMWLIPDDIYRTYNMLLMKKVLIKRREIHEECLLMSLKNLVRKIYLNGLIIIK